MIEDFPELTKEDIFACPAYAFDRKRTIRNIAAYFSESLELRLLEIE